MIIFLFCTFYTVLFSVYTLKTFNKNYKDWGATAVFNLFTAGAVLTLQSVRAVYMLFERHCFTAAAILTQDSEF